MQIQRSWERARRLGDSGHLELKAQQVNKKKCFKFIEVNRFPPLRIALDWAQSRSPNKVSSVELVKFCHRDVSLKNFDIIAKSLGDIVPKIAAVRIYQLQTKLKPLYVHWKDARANRDPDLDVHKLNLLNVFFSNLDTLVKVAKKTNSPDSLVFAWSDCMVTGKNRSVGSEFDLIDLADIENAGADLGDIEPEDLDKALNSLCTSIEKSSSPNLFRNFAVKSQNSAKKKSTDVCNFF